LAAAPFWVDGRLVSPADPALPVELLDPSGCYTTARVRAGQAVHAARHVRRLQRDARTLGLSPPDETSVLAAFTALAESTFGTGEGIVRLDLGRGPDDRCHLVGRTRALGAEPPVWRAVRAPGVHPEPDETAGVKRISSPVVERARRFASAAGADEALLFDARGCLVEGARSNLIVVAGDGRLLAPGPSRGAVAGVAREILCERLAAGAVGPLVEVDVEPGALGEASELVAVNAVRGARPVVSVDDMPVGDGSPGPWAARLARILDREASVESPPQSALRRDR
jgi:branched-subunit amino acid aminotransferase/4-amino-4-deoxychorismate lyase